jgi:membrane protein YdbS with pleckstrin-like domain
MNRIISYSRDEAPQIAFATVLILAFATVLMILRYQVTGFIILKTILLIPLLYCIFVIFISILSMNLPYISADESSLIIRFGPIGFRKPVSINYNWIENIEISERPIKRYFGTIFGSMKGAGYIDNVEAMALRLNQDGVENCEAVLDSLCKDRLPDFGICKTDNRGEYLISDKPRNGFPNIVDEVSKRIELKKEQL